MYFLITSDDKDDACISRSYAGKDEQSWHHSSNNHDIETPKVVSCDPWQNSAKLEDQNQS